MSCDPENKQLLTELDLAGFPDYIVGISHDYAGHSINTASGVGLLMPLGVSPINGPAVDVLRIFSEWNTEYFGLTGSTNTKLTWEAILTKLEFKYPQLKGLGQDFYSKFRDVGGGGWDPLSAESRGNLNKLLARFVKLPAIAEGSIEALVEFESTIEQTVMSWPCLSRKNPASCYPVVAPESLDALKNRLSNFRISSFLLWENSD